MSRDYIPKALRERVAAQAGHRCGYCLTSSLFVGAPFEIDHILPESLGGLTEEDNLWLACPLCNGHKSNRIASLDPLTGEEMRLFDPRRQVWSEHFAWADAGDRIVGITPAGRATVVALQLNRSALVQARRAWVAVGWHPPKD
jgi:hypothetical protein